MIGEPASFYDINLYGGAGVTLLHSLTNQELKKEGEIIYLPNCFNI